MTDQEISDYFWGSVREGAMKLPYCGSCKELFFHPRPMCPKCWAEISEWRAISGRGKLWSHVVMRFPVLRGAWEERLPYTVAFIELEEGPRVLSNIVDCKPEQIKEGMAVEVVYRERDGQHLYLFRPTHTAKA